MQDVRGRCRKDPARKKHEGAQSAHVACRAMLDETGDGDIAGTSCGGHRVGAMPRFTSHFRDERRPIRVLGFQRTFPDERADPRCGCCVVLFGLAGQALSGPSCRIRAGPRVTLPARTARVPGWAARQTSGQTHVGPGPRDGRPSRVGIARPPMVEASRCGRGAAQKSRP